LKSLAQLSGEKLKLDQLFDRVLGLEQMLTTGGGWQDQVGGLIPGIKLLTSLPGVPQMPKWKIVELPHGVIDELNKRLVLVYTGQRRLAKRLLRNIMGNYISGDPKTLSCLNQIQVLAKQMNKLLIQGDLDEFGYLLEQHWQVNKVLDPGCTNPFIDEFFKVVAPYICGGKLAGAGGGVMALVTRDEIGVRRLEKRLIELYSNSDVRVWRCEVAKAHLEKIFDTGSECYIDKE
jgi:fucokinase